MSDLDLPVPPRRFRRALTVSGIARRADGFFLVPAVAVTLGLWIAVSAFAPFATAIPQIGLDASWVAVMGEAADRGLRWGPDITFTYGPASPLVTTYFNDAYLTLTLPLLIATCILVSLCTILLAERSLAARVEASLGVGLVTALAGTCPDGVFLALPIFPLLLALSRDPSSPVRSGVAVATAMAVGMIGLAKMSYPLSALPIFLLADAIALLRRRIPILAAPCIVGFLLADLLYGQSLGDLPVFLARQGEVVAGYSDAMALDGDHVEFWGYLTACAALLLLTTAVERLPAPRRAGARAAVPLGLAWMMLVLLKAGFVRQDTHAAIAWFGLALAAVPVAVARLRPVRPLAALAVTTAAVAGSALFGLSQAGHSDVPSARRIAARMMETVVTRPAAQLSAAWGLVSDAPGFVAARRERVAQGWREIAAQAPMPRLDGSVDIVPSLQSRVIAANLDYRPRPSFQEYSSYTPSLLAANAAFLTGSHAPRWVLFGPETGIGQMTIDGRYPNLAEGALWPDLVRLYRPERRIDSLVALERRAEPAGVALGPPRNLVVGFDEPVTVETEGGKAAFVVVNLRPTPLGRALSILYRMPGLTMSVDFVDGHERTYRFIPGIAAAGFVLSPTVNNASEFVDLADGVQPSPDRTVRSFSLHTATRLGSLLWHAVAVEIRPMSVAAAPTARAAPTATAWDVLAAGEGLAPSAIDLAVVPPSLVSVPVSGLARIEIGYGLALDGNEPAGDEALCFAVHPADGTGRILWQDCLDRRFEADRKPHSLSLAVPPGMSEVALEVSCRSGCDEGVQGYWARP